MQYIIVDSYTNEVLSLYSMPFNILENRLATPDEITTESGTELRQGSDSFKVGDIIPND